MVCDRSDKSDRRVTSVCGGYVTFVAYVAVQRGRAMNIFTKMAEDWIRQNSAQATTQLPPILPVVDPFPWAEDFQKWTLARCVYRDRCFGGIGSLHRDFCEWAIACEEPPCNRQIFEQLLDNAGFLSADGMVSGLILREDFEGVKGYPSVGRLLN
jgi:hypothetical protein